ncbi:PREDICTED: embryonic polarity protein dorsal-like [Ceratosolen solmsi marchali]|uniref:Embryonic polarity protein dorsal-like n=1 Tax=Ceratosolen solmsi marchali TaxID=326594 RepID=A0AAJ6YEI9_9HYME|nr:PREDICTED: embryonic polarity protein dorsal-like [Ceratosolen solmsi marchali]
MKELSEGICYFKTVPNQSVVVFPHLGIQCIKKKDIDRSLTERERLQVDPFKTGFSHKLQPENIDLNCIRLCFQVFLEGQESGNFNIPLDPVVSNPIYDKKGTAELTICWLSHASASVVGGKVMCILCEKIAKDDVQVRFFHEENRWEVIAESVYPHYHKQVAIIFKSPKYIEQDIGEPISVQIQLKRFSDGETSKPVPFQFLPVEVDDQDMLRKKRRKFNEAPRNLVYRHLQAEAAKTETKNYENVSSKPTMPGYSLSTPLLYPSTTNNLDIFRENNAVIDNLSDNRQSYYINQQINQIEAHKSDYPIGNSAKEETSNLYNNMTTVRQKINPINDYDFEFQSLNQIINEPQLQNNTNYVNEFLTTMNGEKLSNDFSTLKDL